MTYKIYITLMERSKTSLKVFPVLSTSNLQLMNISLRFEVEETVTTDEAKNTSFERFCHCTSLHGWKYLSSSVNFTLRIGWVGVVLAAMGVAAFFLGYCCNDFLSSTVQTSQDTSR